MQEQKILDNISRLLFSEMVFIDIGANSGQYTYQVNNNVGKSSIYSIEPNPVKFEKLKSDCCDWEDLSNNTIYPLQIAISDSDGSIQLESNNLADSYKLDTLFTIVKPNLIKIDAIGQELAILKGSVQILQQGRTKFLIALDKEKNSQSSKSNDDLNNFMQSFGYYSQNFSGMLLFINPRKNLLDICIRKYQQILPVLLRQELKNLKYKILKLVYIVTGKERIFS